MKVSDLQINHPIDFLDVKVKEIGETKEFSKFGRIGRVATASIEDETGEIQLTLWDEQIDLVKKGYKIKIIGGYVKEFKGERQVGLGKTGTIEI